ncbi:hypothetical protein BD779DRAFT_1475830 [Infundibulicybe gibba]|nr:hypothetical protein BD779DRAFT_1475830 [Infundibulicybe gibba]
MQGASGIVKLPPLPVTRSKTLAATKVTQTQKVATYISTEGPAKKGVSPLDNSLPDSTSVPNSGNKLRAGETEQRTPSPLSSLSPSPVPDSPASTHTSTDSSDSDSYSTCHALRMPSNPTGQATVEISSSGKPPIMTAGDISPESMRNFEFGCMNYFNQKDIKEADRVRRILGGLHDERICGWIMMESEELEKLSFKQFMAKMRSLYLPKNWEDD